jgi:hypothetical protein
MAGGNLRPQYAYNLATSATSATASRVTPGGVRNVRLASSTQDCYVVIGVAPTATQANGMLIKYTAGYGEEFGIAQGEQIAAISPGGAGSLNVTELTQ